MVEEAVEGDDDEDAGDVYDEKDVEEKVTATATRQCSIRIRFESETRVVESRC